MKRMKVNTIRDKKIFKKTANRVHKANLPHPALRGGMTK